MHITLSAMDSETILTLIVPAVVALASVVAVLWKNVIATHQRTVKKLENSEAEHKEAANKLLDLTAKVGVLEGRQEGVERLAHSVLKEIQKLPCKEDKCCNHGFEVKTED